VKNYTPQELSTHRIWGDYAPELVTTSKEKLIASGVYSEQDSVLSGFQPEDDNGVLYSWSSTPIAFWDICTLNRMLFPKALWEGMLANQWIHLAFQNKNFWGEDCHKDSDEVFFKNVSCRVNRFWLADDNMVLGDVDLMATPMGTIIYALAKTGKIGISSRGFGGLEDIGNGCTRVVVEEYQAVCWDNVVLPACSNAVMTTADLKSFQTDVIEDMIMELRGLIGNALDRHPKDERLLALGSAIGTYGKKSFSYSKSDISNLLVRHAVHSRIK
jgi:hypothetical protein